MTQMYILWKIYIQNQKAIATNITKPQNNPRLTLNNFCKIPYVQIIKIYRNKTLIKKIFIN